MALYLNRVYFGRVSTASKPPRAATSACRRRISPSVSARCLPACSRADNLSPCNNPEGARNARNFVLGRMQDMGFLTAAQARAEQESLLVTSRRTNH